MLEVFGLQKKVIDIGHRFPYLHQVNIKLQL